MNKKIAVLGGNLTMDHMIGFVDDSAVSKFVLIKNQHSIDGVEFSDYVLLDGWASVYRNPSEILLAVKSRIR